MFPHVPKEVLQKRFAECANVLLRVCVDFGNVALTLHSRCSFPVYRSTVLLTVVEECFQVHRVPRCLGVCSPVHVRVPENLWRFASFSNLQFILTRLALSNIIIFCSSIKHSLVAVDCCRCMHPAESGSQALLKATISCITDLLLAQPLAAWKLYVHRPNVSSV